MDKYMDLLEMSYIDAVNVLLKRYGPATNDYFNEISYERLLNGDIKSVTKKKAISRTAEGLYCHHIDENKYENMAKASYIKNQKVPYDSQKREKLVYCDLFEHAILHALISKETNKEKGWSGLYSSIFPNLKEWYIAGRKPQKEWEINCYNKSYLKFDDADLVLYKIANMADLSYF